MNKMSSNITDDDNTENGIWKSTLDTKTNRTYFYNTETKETTWTKVRFLLIKNISFLMKMVGTDVKIKLHILISANGISNP